MMKRLELRRGNKEQRGGYTRKGDTNDPKQLRTIHCQAPKGKVLRISGYVHALHCLRRSPFDSGSKSKIVIGSLPSPPTEHDRQ